LLYIKALFIFYLILTQFISSLNTYKYNICIFFKSSSFKYYIFEKRERKSSW